MTEGLVPSSVLILAVCLLRFLLRGRIGLNLRYGLWGLVALRLVMPIYYPLHKVTDILRSRLSVMNAAEAVKQKVTQGTGIGYLGDSQMCPALLLLDKPIGVGGCGFVQAGLRAGL